MGTTCDLLCDECPDTAAPQAEALRQAVEGVQAAHAALLQRLGGGGEAEGAAAAADADGSQELPGGE